MRRSVLTTLLFSCFALFGLTSCGGGGDGAAPQAVAVAAAVPPAVPEDTTGIVGILIKDGPTDDFLKIMITITRVELLGDDGPQVVFSGEKTFDLLELQNFYDMLAVSDQVPAGEYSKIRLRVGEIVLHRDDGTGGVELIDVDVPGGGRIDLNPRGSFLVSAGAAILIEIDLDARRSIHIVRTGNRDRYRFRPVVFVDVQQRQLANALVRVHGIIGVDSLDPLTGEFDLCRVAVQFQTDRSGCIPINRTEDTRVYDPAGELIDFESLVEEEPVTVYGLAVISGGSDDGDSDSDSEGGDDSDADSDDSDGDGSGGDTDTGSDGDSDPDSDSDSDGDSDADSDDRDSVRLIQIDALVIQEGSNENAVRYDGTVITAADADGVFEFALEPGQGINGNLLLDTLVQESTTILSSALVVQPVEAIEPPLEASVAGVLQLSNSDPDLIKSTLIVLREPNEDQEQLMGTIGMIQSETFEIDMQCVRPTVGARFFYQTETAEGTDVTEGTYADLSDFDGGDATAFGADVDMDGCFETNLVYAVEPTP